MPTLSDLANVLIGCRVVTRARWEQATHAGSGQLAKTLDALAADTPEWWSKDTPEPPPGLTDYQRGVIELWFEDGKQPLARQLAVNQFLLLEKLGQGGQGEVYRGRQLNPPRFVAVKTLTQDTESGRARFEQEARTMMKIQHPGVARFYLYERVRDAAGKPTNEYLIAMEFVDGTDLHRLVNWSGPVAWPFAVKWAIDLLGGLAVIHQSGFIHRDVKPANVIALGPALEPSVRPSETAAKLLDFGAVKRAENTGPTGTGRRVFVGTREYAPPEQWAEQVVPASDLYALGGTLFCVIAGRPPYEVEGRDAIAFMKAHTRAPVPDVSEHSPDVPEELNRLLRKMMAKRPDERGTASELLEEFQRLLPPETGAQSPVAKPAKRAKKAKPPTPAPAASRAATTEAEPRNPFDRALGSVLGLLERVFLPGHLRPARGHELATGERVAVLLRRPLLLITLALLLIFLIFFLVR